MRLSSPLQALLTYHSALVASHQSAKSIPPHLAANLLATLEGLITMPTASSELNEWWCNKPLALKASAVTGKGTGPPMKKRKAEEVVDTSTGVFDSSSESEGEAPATKLSSRDSKKLLPPLLSLAAHKRVFQDCWLALLSLPLNEAESKRVLVILHRQVLPHMTDPKRVMDWLVDSADAGTPLASVRVRQADESRRHDRDPRAERPLHSHGQAQPRVPRLLPQALLSSRPRGPARQVSSSLLPTS